jgi:hypothetical protein
MKFLALFCLAASFVSAQVSTGSLQGLVEDESGRIISGVSIQAREDGTGFVRSTVANGVGAYRLDALLPGNYSVTAARKGFRTFTATHLTLEVNQQAQLNFKLQVGPAHDSITVQAAIPPVEVENSTVGYRLDSAFFLELPLDNRDISSLVTLGPGAIPRQLGGFVHDLDNDVQQGSRGSVAFNPPINGARPSMNAYVLDGAYNTDRNAFAMVINPPMESIQEFRIQSSLTSPAFTNAGGGAIDVVTKSGDKTFHGSAFELFRNEATDARNYFDDPNLSRPIFRRNQFGGSIGGPLPLPSTFFFAAYEGLRGKSAKPSLQLVPDATIRQGDFSQGNLIFDPLNSANGARIPFAGNVIPSNRIDPIAQKYLAQYEPLPNITGNATDNYIDTTPSTSHNNSVSGRIDHQFRRAGLLFGRYTINEEDGGIGGNFPLRPTTENLRAQQIALGHTFARSNWVADTRASFTRLRLFNIPVSAFHQNDAATLGLANPPSDPFAYGLPYFFLTDFSTVTDDPTLPQTQRDNTWDLSNAVSVAHGRHTLKFGVEWIHFQFNYRQSNAIRGRYTYTGAFTGNGVDPNTGDALADFLLGYPQQTTRTVGAAQAYLRESSSAAFVQDEWQITRRLALNLGLRYEYDSPFTDTRNQFLNLDYSNLPQQPGLVPVDQSYDPNLANFSPRVGLAWRLPGVLSRGGETVFRAGYGIYYSPEIAIESYDLVPNGIRTEINSTNGAALPVLTTRDGFPSTASTGLPTYFGLDQHLPTPYVQQWNAGFQRELPKGILFELAYVGSKGTDLGRFRRFNTALHTETGENLPPRPGDLQSLHTFPDLGTIFQRQHIANSSYQSLQIKVEKRLNASLGFLASFVWSKSIDDADSVNIGQFESAGAQDEGNLRLERGLSFSNVPRRLSVGFVYSFPNSDRLRSLLRGWQLSGTLTLQDGTPLNPFYIATDIANTGTPNRPNVVPGQSISLPASQRTAEHWFNTAAFENPAPFTFGNAGRNIIPGPGNEVTNIALHRRFSLTERAGLEFRVESFNIFNHPNFGIPGPYPDLGPFFGKIFSTGDPRRFQFATRLDF